MVTVYFETPNHSYAEKVATFNSEETYISCLKSLEKEAKKHRMVVTESVYEEGFDERVSSDAFNELMSLPPQRCVDTTLAVIMKILTINQEAGEMSEAQVKRVYEYMAQMLYPKEKVNQ